MWLNGTGAPSFVSDNGVKLGEGGWGGGVYGWWLRLFLSGLGGAMISYLLLVTLLLAVDDYFLDG